MIHSAETWRRAQRLFEETALPVSEIVAAIGVSRSALDARRRREGWQRLPARRPSAAKAAPTRSTTTPVGRAARRPAVPSVMSAAPAEAALPTDDGEAPSPDRAKMVGRLFRAFDRQMAEMEARLAASGSPVEEKDARLLGTLARTLEKLIELERDRAGGEAEESVDLDRLREDLAARLRRLCGGGG